MRQQEEMKHSILSQILDQGARARRESSTDNYHCISSSNILVFPTQ